MNITCPKCETTFSLPDDLYKPGRKSRCSHCGNIFPMPPLADAPQNDEELPPPPTRAKKRAGFFSGKLFKAVCAFAAAVLLVLLGYGGFLIYGALVPGEVQQALTPANPESKPGDGSGGGPGTGRVEDERRIASISLEEIRQFMVENPAGRMMVIQGLAVNASESNKDYVAIEARLLDADNKTLDRAEQLCGAPLSLFQLQSLTVSELKEALNNRISIMTNNTNIPPGGKVPFVVVFPSPPRGTATFEVRVLDVRDSPPAQGG